MKIKSLLVLVILFFISGCATVPSGQYRESPVKTEKSRIYDEKGRFIGTIETRHYKNMDSVNIYDSYGRRTKHYTIRK